MTNKEAADAMDALAGWANDKVGEPGRPNAADILHDPDARAALQMAANALRAMARDVPVTPMTSPAMPKMPGGGKTWAHEEDDYLTWEFKSGIGIPVIARRHNRTPLAICARLDYLRIAPLVSTSYSCYRPQHSQAPK